ncbi:MAG: hypothetical protein ACI9CF_001449 [Candidatus Omnitrophota bacterium]|jgi:hypothetical protein
MTLPSTNVFIENNSSQIIDIAHIDLLTDAQTLRARGGLSRLAAKLAHDPESDLSKYVDKWLGAQAQSRIIDFVNKPPRMSSSNSNDEIDARDPESIKALLASVLPDVIHVENTDEILDMRIYVGYDKRTSNSTLNAPNPGDIVVRLELFNGDTPMAHADFEMSFLRGIKAKMNWSVVEATGYLHKLDALEVMPAYSSHYGGRYRGIGQSLVNMVAKSAQVIGANHLTISPAQQSQQWYRDTFHLSQGMDGEIPFPLRDVEDAHYLDNKVKISHVDPTPIYSVEDDLIDIDALQKVVNGAALQTWALTGLEVEAQIVGSLRYLQSGLKRKDIDIALIVKGYDHLRVKASGVFVETLQFMLGEGVVERLRRAGSGDMIFLNFNWGDSPKEVDIFVYGNESTAAFNHIKSLRNRVETVLNTQQPLSSRVLQSWVASEYYFGNEINHQKMLIDFANGEGDIGGFDYKWRSRAHELFTLMPLNSNVFKEWSVAAKNRTPIKTSRMSSGGEDQQISRSLTPAEIQEKLGEIFPSQIPVVDSDKKLRLDIRVENERRTSRPDDPRDPRDLVMRFELWDEDRRVAHADMEMSYDSVYTAFVKNSVFSSEGYIDPVNALEVLPLYSYRRGGQYKGVGLSLIHMLFKAAYIMGAHDLELVAGHSIEPWYKQVVGMGQLQNGHMNYHLIQAELGSIEYLEQGIHIQKVDPDPIYSVEDDLIHIDSLQRLIKAAAVHAQAETGVRVSAYIVGSIRYLQSGLNRKDIDIELIINADKANRQEAQKVFESCLKELLSPVRVHDITSQQSVANVDWLLDYGGVQKSFEIYISRNTSKAAEAKLYTIQRSLKTSLIEGRINRLKDLQFWIAAEYYIGSDENHASMLKEFDNGTGDLRAFESKWRDRILELNEKIDLLQDELWETVSERAEADLSLSRMSASSNSRISPALPVERIQELLAEQLPGYIEVDGKDKRFTLHIRVDDDGRGDQKGKPDYLKLRLELKDGLKPIAHMDMELDYAGSEWGASAVNMGTSLFSTMDYDYFISAFQVLDEYSKNVAGEYIGIGSSLMHLGLKAAYLMGLTDWDILSTEDSRAWYIKFFDLRNPKRGFRLPIDSLQYGIDQADYLEKNLKITRIQADPDAAEQTRMAPKDDSSMSSPRNPQGVLALLESVLPGTIDVGNSDDVFEVKLRVENDERPDTPLTSRKPGDIIARIEIMHGDERVAHTDFEIAASSYSINMDKSAFSTEGYAYGNHGLEVLPLYSRHKGGRYRGVGQSLMKLVYKAAHSLGAGAVSLNSTTGSQAWYLETLRMQKLADGNLTQSLDQIRVGQADYIDKNIRIEKLEPMKIYSAEDDVIDIEALQRIVDGAALQLRAQMGVSVEAHIVGSLRYLGTGQNRDDIDLVLIVDGERDTRETAKVEFIAIFQEMLGVDTVTEARWSNEYEISYLQLDFGEIGKSMEIFVSSNESESAQDRLYLLRGRLQSVMRWDQGLSANHLQSWIAAEYYLGKTENHQQMLIDFDNGQGDLAVFEDKWRERAEKLLVKMSADTTYFMERSMAQKIKLDIAPARMGELVEFSEAVLNHDAARVQKILKEVFPTEITVDGEDKAFDIGIQVNLNKKSHAIEVRFELFDDMNAVGHVDIRRGLGQSEKTLISRNLFSNANYSHGTHGLEVNPEYSFKRRGLYKGLGKSLMHMAFKASYLLGVEQVRVMPLDAKWYINTLGMTRVGTSGVVAIELANSGVENRDYLAQSLKINRSRRKNVLPASRMTQPSIDEFRMWEPVPPFYLFVPLTALEDVEQNALMRHFANILAVSPMDVISFHRGEAAYRSAEYRDFFNGLIAGEDFGLLGHFDAALPDLATTVDITASWARDHVREFDELRSDWPVCCGPTSRIFHMGIGLLNARYDRTFEATTYYDGSLFDHQISKMQDLRLDISTTWLVDLTAEQWSENPDFEELAAHPDRYTPSRMASPEGVQRWVDALDDLGFLLPEEEKESMAYFMIDELGFDKDGVDQAVDDFALSYFPDEGLFKPIGGLNEIQSWAMWSLQRHGGNPLGKLMNSFNQLGKHVVQLKFRHVQLSNMLYRHSPGKDADDTEEESLFWDVLERVEDVDGSISADPHYLVEDESVLDEIEQILRETGYYTEGDATNIQRMSDLKNEPLTTIQYNGVRFANLYFQGDQRLFNISARLTRGDEWGLGSDEYAWPAHKSVPQKPAQQKRLVMSDLYSMSIKAALVQDKKAADVIWSHLGDQDLQAKPVNVLIDLDQYLKRANPAEQKLVQAQFEWARRQGIARIRFIKDRPGFISDVEPIGEEVELPVFRFWSLGQHRQLEDDVANNLPYSDKNFVAPLIPLLHMHVRQALIKNFDPHLKNVENRLFKFMTGRSQAATNAESAYLTKYQSNADLSIYEDLAVDLPMLNQYLNFMIWAEKLKRTTSGVSA